MSHVSFKLGPAHFVPLESQARAFTSAFSDYVTGPIALDVEGLARYFFGQGVDLWLSRLATSGEQVLGFGYINRTGEIARLAGMGLLPEARGKRIGSSLLSTLVEQSRGRAERLMTLEVFEQNPPAVALYRRAGFRVVGRLFGWQFSAGGGASREPLDEITLLEAGQLATVFDYPAVPWQVSRHALLKSPPGSRVFKLGGSLAAVTSPDAEKPAIRMLHQQASNWAELRTLVSRVLDWFPKRRWSAPAIFPEMFGREVFEPLGFTREPLNQFQMELALKA